MKKIKIWSILMLIVMGLPAMVACEGDDDGEGSPVTITFTSSNLTDDGYFDGLMYYKITSNSPLEVTVYKAEKNVIKVDIPNIVSIDGRKYKCTSISDEAFYGCSGLTSVTIPNTVTSIGKEAFYNCSSLEKVIVNDIAAWCNIKFVSYSSNPLYYANHLYSNENTEIKDLVIPNSVTSIGEKAFFACSCLKSVTIPNSVTSIGNNAFSYCI